MTSAAPASLAPRGKGLTAIAIEKLKPKSYRYEVGDPGAQGLRVLVTPTGHKSFIVRFSVWWATEEVHRRAGPRSV